MLRSSLSLPGFLAILISWSFYSQTIEGHITALLSQITVQEKILQLHQNSDAFSTADNTRFGIRGFLMADGPHGVRVGTAIGFPAGIGMAATWDVHLGWEIATLVNERKAPGRSVLHVDAAGLANGVYLCRLTAVGPATVPGTAGTSLQYTQTRKMLVVTWARTIQHPSIRL